MAVDGVALSVGAVIFLGTLVRSALGFGEALVAVPLMALLIPVEEAAPVAVLVSVAIAAMILLQDWRKVHFRSAGRLIVSTLFGIPAGLMLLRFAPQPAVKAVLALVIMSFSLHALANSRRQALHDDRWAWLFGLQAGILGGAYGMNGPPLAIYGSLRRWQPEHFRATLQAYFLPASIAGMAGYWFAGLWTPAVNRYFLMSLPGVAAAVLIGRLVHLRMNPQRFTKLVYIGLTAIGAILMLQAALALR